MDVEEINIFSESDVDSDEDLDDFENIVFRRPYTVRQRPDHVNFWDDDDFKIRFRLSKDCFIILLQRLEHILRFPTERTPTLNPSQQLLLTLRFYASGSMLITVGDFIGVQKTTVCRIIRRVTHAICQLKGDYISLPEGDEILQVQQGFYDIAAFPRCLLAIDGTHVRIQSPGGNNAEQFRNRKGFFSFNVMVACDHQMKFRNVIARWPGASNDINVFDNSYLKARFEQGMGNCLILGDSGYAVTKYLMTPLQQTTTQAEELYNESLIRTRNKVECAIGIWKRRFPICALGMRVKLELAQDIIIATAILHNIAREMNEAELEVNEDIENAINEAVPNIAIQHNYNNNWYRSDLINHYFARLL